MARFLFLSCCSGTLLRRAVRISLRSKVNDSLVTGIRLIDSLLPVGKGQRQLILGDRFTGKTSIFLFTVLSLNLFDGLADINGFGAKRVIALYCGIGQNLTKLASIINKGPSNRGNRKGVSGDKAGTEIAQQVERSVDANSDF
jgi:F0F1-type ATP synthase alpha subunit